MGLMVEKVIINLVRTQWVWACGERGHKGIIIGAKSNKKVNRKFSEGDEFTSNGKSICKHLGFIEIGGN